MNSKFIASTVIAIAALTGANAFAQTTLSGEAAYVVPAPATTTSSVTRTQVQAEYLQARKDGNVAVSNEAVFAVAPAAMSVLSRSEVSAEATKAHQLDGRTAS